MEESRGGQEIMWLQVCLTYPIIVHKCNNLNFV